MTLENKTILKIDHDDLMYSLDVIASKIKVIMGLIGCKSASMETYRTRRGRHIYVVLENYISSDYEIMLLQCLLGSDINRELCNFERVKSGIMDGWNVLFTSKWRGRQKVSEEIFESRAEFTTTENNRIVFGFTTIEKNIIT